MKKMIELLRKGLGFVLLSMGVSRPAAKSQGGAAKSGKEPGRSE